MGWFKSMTTPRIRSQGEDAEMGSLFEKIRLSLTDENFQNQRLNPFIRAQVVNGRPCDQLPDGFGEFGRCATNPIPVNGPFGQVVYLSSLRTGSGQSFTFHRIGSISARDVYEAVSLDGTQWEILFLDTYHPRRAKLAPTSIYLANGPNSGLAIHGTNAYLARFPNDAYEGARQCARRMVDSPSCRPRCAPPLTGLCTRGLRPMAGDCRR